MKKEHSSHLIFAVFALMASLLVWTWGANVVQAESMPSQFSIAGNGQVIAKHAQVISVSGTTVVVEMRWGATKLRWRLETTGSTKFYPDGKSREVLAATKPGDSVSFSGLLNDASAEATIRAAVVRNHTLLAAREVPASELPVIPESGSHIEASVTPATDTADGNQLLLVAATSTGLIGWLWKYLYRDPTALSMR